MYRINKGFQAVRTTASFRAIRTSTAVLVLALGAVMIQPAQAEAHLQCEHCRETQINGPNGPVWVHYFWLASTLCDDWPDAESCRACGGSSECHGPEEQTEVTLGRCHQPCAPAFALRDLDQAVTVLAADLDAQTGEILADRVAAETSLVYDARGNAVELVSCRGVLKRWTLAESARPYFAARQ